MHIVADSKIPQAEEAFHCFGDVQVVPTMQLTRERIKDADAILIRSETKVDEALLDGTRVRFVGTATIGTDHVDLAYLKRQGIAFASCPGSNANSVAEYVLAALLELAAVRGFALRGKTLGIVGHGNTGSRTARKAEAVGMRVLLNDPPLARQTGDPRYLPLDALMEADIVSLHVPLTHVGQDATFHRFDERRLAAMKRGAILINTSRGAVVDTLALKHALRSRRLDACVLDVWENEPAIDIELLEQAAIATPHIAGYSHDGKLNATRMLQEALGMFCGVRPDPPASEKTPSKLPIVLPAGDRDPENLLRIAVNACYNIRRDDEALRKSITLPAEQRAEYFRRLRSGYPVRWEFHHYVVDGSGLEATTAQMFRAIGFCVE